MHLTSELIDKIKGVMAHNEITQKDLAARLDVSVMTVSRWMTGATSKLSIPVWKRLSALIEEHNKSKLRTVIEKPISVLEINEDETVLCSTDNSETILLSSDNNSSMIFKSPLDHIKPYFHVGDLLICEAIESPQKDQLILINHNDENLILWCDGQIDDNFYFRNNGDNTALVIQNNSWSFIACIKEIRIKNFVRQ